MGALYDMLVIHNPRLDHQETGKNQARGCAAHDLVVGFGGMLRSQLHQLEWRDSEAVHLGVDAASICSS